MSNFEFVSHEAFHEDKYVKEIVYMLVNGLRIGYVHKVMQSGGSFWDVMGTSVMVNGERESYKAVKFGDSFLADDIKGFLKRRKWETHAAACYQKPTSMSEASIDEHVPF